MPLRRSRLTVHVPTVLCGILYHAMPWTNPPSNKVSVAQSVNQEAFLLTPLLELTSCYPFLESTLLAAPGMRARLYDQLIPCRAHVSLCRSSRIVLRQRHSCAGGRRRRASERAWSQNLPALLFCAATCHGLAHGCVARKGSVFANRSGAGPW